jgi:4-amino-4-deoxy-L-arabinose transferase-like glycosyltransferase
MESDGRAAAGLSRRVRVIALSAVLLVSLGAHLWGLTRDLPMPDVDERYFVTPAAYIAASGDLNPHWFGHPGSTVIYPLAIAFRLREVVFHGAPLTGAAPSVAARLQTDAESFYLMGRLWAVAFALASLVLVFAIGRRLFGDLVAFVGTLVWAVAPLGVQYGKITRTDSVGLFFALLTIWLCLRALDRPSIGRFVAIGGAAGLGVASRYFLAVLAVLIGVTWLLARARSATEPADPAIPRRAPNLAVLATGFGAMFATFALTTPFFFLDLHNALQSAAGEASPPVPAQSSGFLNNIDFYLSGAIPGAISRVGMAAALVGIVVALLRRTPGRTLLLVWPPCVLLAISVLSLHWDRWVIPALPALALFAAFGTVTVARAVAARLRDPARARWAFATVLAVLTAALVVGPASALVALDRTQAETSTRLMAARWIERHIPPGNGVAVELKGPDLSGTRYRYVEHYALPNAGTVTDYAHAGYRYLVVNDTIARGYHVDRHRFRAQAAFYGYLRDDARRLATFRHGRAHGGPHLVLYDLGGSYPPPERDHSRDAMRAAVATLRFTSRNRVAHGDNPVPYDVVRLHRWARRAEWVGPTVTPTQVFARSSATGSGR